MSEAHYTYYIKLDDHGYGDEFFISGSGAAGWEYDWTKDLDWHSDCSGTTGMKVYKFDQSDPSNIGYRFELSETQGGTNDGGTALTEGEGVYYCGTPGFAGASTKFNVSEYYSFSNIATVYPFASLGPLPSDNACEFLISETFGELCTSGDYACCTLEEMLSGKLSTVIGQINTELSGQYTSFETTSYDIKTGWQTGKWIGCVVLATGASEVDVNARRNEYAFRFQDSGECYNDRRGGLQGTQNVTNSVIDWGIDQPQNYYAGDAWESRITGYFTKRWYVSYSPVISGKKTAVSVDVCCPETTLDVTLERDRKIWDTTGTAQKENEAVRNLDVTLQATCAGHETVFGVGCNKIQNGIEKYCGRTALDNEPACWDDDFEEGNYVVKYVSGAFETSGNKHIIGTGFLKVSEEL